MWVIFINNLKTFKIGYLIYIKIGEADNFWRSCLIDRIIYCKKRCIVEQVHDYINVLNHIAITFLNSSLKENIPTFQSTSLNWFIDSFPLAWIFAFDTKNWKYLLETLPRYDTDNFSSSFFLQTGDPKRI